MLQLSRFSCKSTLLLKQSHLGHTKKMRRMSVMNSGNESAVQLLPTNSVNYHNVFIDSFMDKLKCISFLDYNKVQQYWVFAEHSAAVCLSHGIQELQMISCFCTVFISEQDQFWDKHLKLGSDCTADISSLWIGLQFSITLPWLLLHYLLPYQ